ncbi:MAG: TIGR02452 family protein [Selenomonadaceae bacterium]|nr:TIGR02452 family protein [Selenomonadaceae bacterium]
MPYVSNTELIKNFVDTVDFYVNDGNLRKAIGESIKATKFYAADDYPPMPEKKFAQTKISVIKRRTFETAAYLKKRYPETKIAVHNFASAIIPGGRIKSGSRSQENALCRCSTLYPVLGTDDNFKRYYDVNKAKGNDLSDDACIYTPDIVVCKSDTDLPERLPREEWITVDVMTIAAPSLRKISVDDNELAALHEKRLRHMFTVLVDNGAEIFVTGAFGCGVFRNNPEVVAQVYKKILAEFDGYFKEVIFAIYCKPSEVGNYETFRKILAE